MASRYLGALPDPEWRGVLAHCLARSDSFAVRMPDGDGPLSGSRAEVESLPEAEIRPWSGMRDAVEIRGPLTPRASAAFESIETSLVDLDDRKLWDYRLLRGTQVLLSIGDFTDLLVDEHEIAVLRAIGVLVPDEPA